jgi:hypothetical protein
VIWCSLPGKCNSVLLKVVCSYRLRHSSKIFMHLSAFTAALTTSVFQNFACYAAPNHLNYWKFKCLLNTVRAVGFITSAPYIMITVRTMKVKFGFIREHY